MISVVILTKNEEVNLTQLLPQLDFSDDIIMIDNGSTDQTAVVGKKFHCTFHQDLDPSFASRRNAGMKCAKHSWVLYIDADERISPALRQEILTTISQNTSVSAYAIERIDIFWGKQVRYGEVLKARTHGIIRLVQRNSGTWVGHVHEVFVPKGSTGKLQNHLTHYSHSGIADFLASVNSFSTLRAEEMYNSGTRLWGLQILTVPFVKFVYTFFILGGFLDGARGFVYSFMMSFHSFLSRSKVYLLQNS